MSEHLTSGMDVVSALKGQSMRAYKATPVPMGTVMSVLEAARFAPSGTNTQPWNVVVVSGAVKEALCERVSAFREAHPEREQSSSNIDGEYKYYPDQITEPYLSRRRKVGWEMYRSMGVAKGDRQASWRVAARNYRFFDAPVGLIFTLERDLEKGSWIDLGIFLQSVMLAARHYGLDACAQGAWARYHDVVRAELGIPQSQVVVCGMAMGYGDPDAPANRIKASREPVDVFARLMGWETEPNGTTAEVGQ